MVCKKCGKRLKEGKMFCTVCGYFNDPNDISNYDDNKKENFTNDDEVDFLRTYRRVKKHIYYAVAWCVLIVVSVLLSI